MTSPWRSGHWTLAPSPAEPHLVLPWTPPSALPDQLKDSGRKS